MQWYEWILLLVAAGVGFWLRGLLLYRHSPFSRYARSRPAPPKYDPPAKARPVPDHLT